MEASGRFLYTTMIRKIKYTNNYQHINQSDVERLQRVMLQNGYDADFRSAADIWKDYSDDYAAEWLGMPDDDIELWETIRYKVEEVAQ